MTWLRQTLGAVALTLVCATSAHSQTLIRDAEIEKTLRDMSTPIFEAAGLAPSSVELFILRASSLNAFVAGGRRMFFHTGLLVDLETPEELQGVMAHEAGHITGGHLARRAINLRNAEGPALFGLLLGILAGAAGGGEAVLAGPAISQGILLRSILKFNRGEEAAADQAGLSFLERAEIDPRGLQKVLQRFRGQEVLSVGNVDPFVLTHPLSTQRTALVERRVNVHAGRVWPKNPERDYWHGRMRAKLYGFLADPTRVLRDLADEPESETRLYAEAIALHRLPDHTGAITAIDKLISLRPNDPYYHELKGQILLESGKPHDAVPSYRKAVALDPRSPLIKAGLGKSLLLLRTPEADAEALVILKEARSTDLADASALRDLATAYDRAGDRGMATLATAERYALTGRLRDSMQLAKRATKILPEGTPAWLRAKDILKLDRGG